MQKYFSFTSPAIFLIAFIITMLSGNDKAIFLMVFPIVYSLGLSFWDLATLIKAVNKKKAGLDFIIAFSPIILTAIIILLVKQGMIKGV